MGYDIFSGNLVDGVAEVVGSRFLMEVENFS